MAIIHSMIILIVITMLCGIESLPYDDSDSDDYNSLYDYSDSDDSDRDDYNPLYEYFDSDDYDPRNDESDDDNYFGWDTRILECEKPIDSIFDSTLEKPTHPPINTGDNYSHEKQKVQFVSVDPTKDTLANITSEEVTTVSYLDHH